MALFLSGPTRAIHTNPNNHTPNMTSTTIKSVTLYFRRGRSDKVYQAAIEELGDRFIVAFAYGRRGSTLKAGTKTPQPVGLVEAQRIHSKLVASKLAKGYRPGLTLPPTTEPPPSPPTPASSRSSPTR